jgi:hypothetical protein
MISLFGLTAQVFNEGQYRLVQKLERVAAHARHKVLLYVMKQNAENVFQ